MKYCATCKQLLQLSQFYSNRSCKDGRCGNCKECHKAYIAGWRLTSKGKASYKESSQRRNQRYYLKHLEERRARGRTYRKAYYKKHREEILADHKVRHYAPRDIQRTRLQWRLSSARRKAFKLSLPATLTIDHWKAILKAYGSRCAYCGRRSSRLTQDHVIPLVKGGGTTPDNIVPACLSCNIRKHTGSPPSIPAKRLLL